VLSLLGGTTNDLSTHGTGQRTAGGRIGWLAAILACALLGAFVIPAVADAKRGLVTGLEGHDAYRADDAAERNLWLDRTVDAGAGIIRVGVAWAGIATAQPADPTNPGSVSYNFSSVDPVVRSAAAHGVDVLLTVNQAPTWAEGPGRPAGANVGSWDPNPAFVADFMQAVASRYSGSFAPPGDQPLPAVKAIQVWNEPNQDFWLGPQFQGTNIVGPDHYREILNASYKAIKAVNPKMLVVTGGTSPYGDNPGGPYPPPPNGPRVRPVQWWEDLLCVRDVKAKKGKKKGKKGTATRKLVRAPGCGGTAMFDVLAHQPIDNTGKGPLQHGPNRYDASTPDLGRVVSVLRAGEKFGTASGGRHPVWVTEFWWDSKPPNRSGAPLATQARWLQQSLYLFWKAGASAAINFAIRDTTEFPNTRNGFQSGIYFRDGRPKPSLTAFRFPFVTERINRTKLLAWGKAPKAGQLKIQRRQGKRWMNIRKLRVGKGSVFQANLKLPGKQQLRAVVGKERSLVWKQAAAGSGDAGDGGWPWRTIFLVLLGALVLLLALAALRRRQVVRRRRTRMHGRARTLRIRATQGNRPSLP
jgi:Cellulase (glycosyl hydrolase family 5)